MRSTGNGPDVPPRALWYLGDGRIELRACATPSQGAEFRMRALHSAVSRGTERLVLDGRVPESEWRRMRAPRQEGEFPGPVKYGYAMVARVEEGPRALVGREAFCLHPHEETFSAGQNDLHFLPAGLSPRRATLAANMETALNALWDSGAGACDRVVVVGAGVVGLLVSALAAKLPGAEVTVVDIDDSRRAVVEALGAVFAGPRETPRDADVVLHASASAAGLASALGAAGEEAAVVEMSWYGEKEVAVPLGQAFHARRLRLISSQVGQVAPSRRPRWSRRRRLAAALDLLAADERFDWLIDVEIPFADAPDELPARLAAGAEGIGVVLTYC